MPESGSSRAAYNRRFFVSQNPKEKCTSHEKVYSVYLQLPFTLEYSIGIKYNSTFHVKLKCKLHFPLNPNSKILLKNH